MNYTAVPKAFEMRYLKSPLNGEGITGNPEVKLREILLINKMV